VERRRASWAISPNALASSLTTGRTKLIGLISNNFHNPLFLEVFDLFTRGLAGSWPAPAAGQSQR
jgi:DNA-binding LacI/PurR family transcriptional regulator